MSSKSMLGSSLSNSSSIRKSRPSCSRKEKLLSTNTSAPSGVSMAANRFACFRAMVQPGAPATLAIGALGFKVLSAAIESVQGCVKLLGFSLSSIGWRRGLGRGGAFLPVSPLLGPLPTRSSRGEDGALDAALGSCGSRARPARQGGGDFELLRQVAYEWNNSFIRLSNTGTAVHGSSAASYSSAT